MSRLRLRLLHGDARFARVPVLLGVHSDGLLEGAAAQLDQRWRVGTEEGPLRALQRLQRLPRALGEARALRAPPPLSTPPALALAGLGLAGTLTQAGLQQAAAAGFVELAAEQPGPLVALLIGCGDGALPVAESVEALVLGALQARSRLGAIALPELHLLTLYEDLALEAAQALTRLLASAAWRRRVRWDPALLESAEGRRKRRRWIETGARWQRWIVESHTDADGEQRLRFLRLGERARADELASSGATRLADDLLARASANVQVDDALSATLAALLLPPALRALAPEPHERLLLLDAGSARFPWELLPGAPGDEPPAVARPLLRQLRGGLARPAPRHAEDDALLVIGHPDLQGWQDMPELPGARAEAQAVGALARRARLPLTEAIDAPAAEIVQALHARPWRLLHLAGHGLVGRRSGLAIGPDTLLTPGDLAQLAVVPEFVFINACHQGRIGGGETAWAATLGLACIEMGARAVICAGWAVHDAAALQFARALYRSLFAGQPFAQALQSARRACWQAHPRLTTWGAYQAWGDPDWRLARAGRAAPVRAAAPPFFLPQELRTELENLGEATRARQQRGETLDGLRLRLRETLRRAPPAWRTRGDVAAALGFCYSEAALDAKARLWLERALRAADGEAPLRAAERAAQHRMRLAALDTGPRALARLDVALAALREFQHRAPAASRLLLIAQALQVRLWLQDGAQQAAALPELAAAYRRAWDAAPGAHALAGWALACALWVGPQDARLHAFPALLADFGADTPTDRARLALARWMFDADDAALARHWQAARLAASGARERQQLEDERRFVQRLGRVRLGSERQAGLQGLVEEPAKPSFFIEERH